MKYILVVLILLASCAHSTLPSVYMGMAKGECNPHPKDDAVTCCTYHNDTKTRERIVCDGTPETP